MTMRFVAQLLLIAVTACAGSGSPRTPALPDSAFVLPGPFSEQTTVADLEARYGAANVKRGALPDGESGIVLFPDDPTQRAYVQFWDDPPSAHMASVTVIDPESRWRGKRGVRIGTTLAELRALNGAEFFFSGFGFYSPSKASLRDGWNAGALDVTEGEQLYFGLDLALRDAETLPATAYPGSEEGQVSSEDPRYPKLGELAVVSAITAWSSLDDEW
jgi:hypothetical protein